MLRMYPFWGCTSDFTSSDILLLRMNKTISVNPELFMLSSNRKSSKKREHNDKKDNEIQVKAPKKDRIKAMRKQHILRFLREKQEQNYKNLLSGEETNTKKAVEDSKKSQVTPSSNFQQSVEYFNDLSKRQQKPEETNRQHNYTAKVYHDNAIPTPSTPPSLSQQQTNTLQHSTNTEAMVLSEPTIKNTSKPTWGCLKNGNLPTFRDWKRATQKVGGHTDSERKYEMKAMMDAKEKYLVKPRTWNKKQKKTVRRKYNVGRYPNMSKVAVLVSNKTIRNNILNKKQTIQMTPIDEIKKFLIKKGFIRVGTTAPNDVLMKMYETANLICGEIENHNADNLLYNYINDVNEAIS